MQKVLGTAAVWGGVVALCYMFHSFGMLSALGSSLLVLGAFLTTREIWE